MSSTKGMYVYISACTCTSTIVSSDFPISPPPPPPPPPPPVLPADLFLLITRLVIEHSTPSFVAMQQQINDLENEILERYFP